MFPLLLKVLIRVNEFCHKKVRHTHTLYRSHLEGQWIFVVGLIFNTRFFFILSFSLTSKTRYTNAAHKHDGINLILDT